MTKLHLWAQCERCRLCVALFGVSLFILRLSEYMGPKKTNLHVFLFHGFISANPLPPKIFWLWRFYFWNWSPFQASHANPTRIAIDICPWHVLWMAISESYLRKKTDNYVFLSFLSKNLVMLRHHLHTPPIKMSWVSKGLWVHAFKNLIKSLKIYWLAMNSLNQN